MTEPVPADSVLPPHLPRLICGRPTRKGYACKRTQVAVEGFYVHFSFLAAACVAHLTDGERSEYERFADLIRNEDELARIAYHQSLPVECWNWPVTDEHRRRAEEARVCADPRQARALARKLLADWQGRRCAICKGEAECLDHDHDTGLVRGWLCDCCNTGEGFADIPGGRFDRYRQRNPASILGLTIRYFSPITGWAEPAPPPLPYEQHPSFVLAERFGAGRD